MCSLVDVGSLLMFWFDMFDMFFASLRESEIPLKPTKQMSQATTPQSNSPVISHVKKLDQGKQGITGLATYDGVLCVYKISQYMNYLTNHEYLILKGIESLRDVCPHFCRPIGLVSMPIHPNFRSKDQNPFEESKYPVHPIYLDVLFMEYIQDSIPLYNLIREPTIPMDHLMSCIKQVMMAILIAQREKQFVHYDLHSLNILIRDVDVNQVYLYILDDKNAIIIPSYGYNPVIIDFGFSYSSDLNDHPSYLSLAYTDAGYMSPACDTIADSKIFLVSLAEDFHECRRKSVQATRFRNIVRNLFAPLRLVWTSGWDKTNESSIVDRIFRYVENANETSTLFRKSPHMCMDILQSLITLPLAPKVSGSLDDLEKAYRTLVYAFSPIEQEINGVFYTLYAFRTLVNTARSVKVRYYAEPERRLEVVRQFKNEFMNEITKSIPFCMFREVRFDVLLCALYSFGEQLEYQLHRMLNKLIHRKTSQYHKLELQSLQDMFSVLAVNFDESYQFTTSTVVHVLDIPKKQKTIIECGECEPSLLDELNGMDNYARGLYLMEMYKQSI